MTIGLFQRIVFCREADISCLRQFILFNLRMLVIDYLVYVNEVMFV